MKELSCVLDFWKIQLKAIRTCLSCKTSDSHDDPYVKKKESRSYRPSVAKVAVENDEDKVLLSTYDLV